LSRLYETRETVGWDNFACSYMNTVEDKRGAIFHADWWRETYFDALPRDRTFTFTIGIDLATSVKERADYTAGCVVARDDRNEWWVLHHARIKTDDGHRQFVQGLWDWCAEQGYPVSRIIMESNQAQEAIVTAIQRQTPLPVIGRRTDVDKRAKARGAATFYESHRVHHHTSLKGRELESELRSFDKGHDDLVDALCLAMDITGHSGTTLGVSPPPERNLSPTGPVLRGPETVPFRDGARQVPPHVVDMLRGIPTETLTFEEATRAMNASMLSKHLKSILPGIRR
jgi:phage terminase large subunit-like protein